ncbi:MAG: hypothetical protein FWF51_01530 [Chitinivibrionia bacterium]|jgi:hypothetical protein|nr:hypothetical protein [Chitinivibrionia bacterium]
MKQNYDLGVLLKNPDKPLTKKQYENFHLYMKFTNDDKSAKDVDIGPAINERCKEIDAKKTYWR